MLKFECEVAVIGAGPYGLSVASHLRAADIETRVFGETMSFWRKHMPKGMKLRSSPAASDFADPKGELTFEAFTARQGVRPTAPIPLEMFLRYGEWFRKHTLADLDTRKVVRVDPLGDGFCLWLDDGGHVTAQRVVAAVGLARQEFRPAAFSGLPRDYVSSVCEHIDVSGFRGKRVAVIGRGLEQRERKVIVPVAQIVAGLLQRANRCGEVADIAPARTHDRCAQKQKHSGNRCKLRDLRHRPALGRPRTKFRHGPYPFDPPFSDSLNIGLRACPFAVVSKI